MEVIKQSKGREGCHNFCLKEGNKELDIVFGGNLDLYWSFHRYSNEDKIITSEETIKKMYAEIKDTFIITKENYFIYSLFEQLYDDIKESRIYTPTIKIASLEDDELSLDEDINKSNEYYKNRSIYQRLFDGETIEWHSDEEEYSIADRVVIKKVDDTFVLEFTSPEITEEKFFYRMPESVSIRFRNSGSLYEPFNIIFMRMFNKLQEYDPEYHQTHIEEMIYHKKLARKK